MGAVMAASTATYDKPVRADAEVERDARELLGQVMGYVAVTVGFTALGAYLGRDLGGGAGLLLFIPAFAAIIGLHFAPPGAASNSRSASCSGWACCSGSRSRR